MGDGVPELKRLPLPIAETVGARGEKKVFPQPEIDRKRGYWQETINTVWQENRPLLDDNYAKVDTVEAEMGNAISQDDLEKEVKRREQAVKDARTIEPAEIPKETIDQIIASDKEFQGKENDPDVRKNAAQKEIERRKALRGAFGILRAPETAREAARKASEEAVIKAIEKQENEINEATQQIEKDYQKDLDDLLESKKQTDSNAVLTDEDKQTARANHPLGEMNAEQIRVEVSREVTAKYINEEQVKFYPDGTPESEVDYSKSYPAIMAELQRISTGKTAGAIHANRLIISLQYNEKENKFKHQTAEEIKINQESVIRLERMRGEAIAFLTSPELLNDDKLGDAAINALAQLSIFDQPNTPEHPYPEGFIVNDPPEAREVMLRQALGSFQEFRRKLLKKGEKGEEKFSSGILSWASVEQEVNNYPGKQNKIDLLKLHLREQGADERLINLVDTGGFTEAMLAIYSSSLVETKHKAEVLKTSSALKSSGLVKFLNENQKHIELMNQLIFGSEEERKRMRQYIAKEYGRILGNLPENKWKLAAKIIGGMFFITVLGRADDVLSTGVPQQGEGQGGPQGG